MRKQLESFEAFGRVGPAQGVAVRATLQGLNKGRDGILHLRENCGCFCVDLEAGGNEVEVDMQGFGDAASRLEAGESLPVVLSEGFRLGRIRDPPPVPLV